MNRLMRFWKLLFLASVTVFLVSCGDDPIDVDPTSPTVTESNSITGVQEAASTVTITIKGVKGTADLQSLKITEDGEVLAVDRITFGGATPASGTILLTGADVSGFEKDVTIDLPETSGTYEYTFTLTDGGAKTDIVSVDVEVKGLTTTVSDTLYNFRGPLPGGLNLSTGKKVAKGSEFPNDPEKGWPGAHIRDNGNANPGNNTFPWLGQIIPWNESEVRKVATATYDSAKNATAIVTAFNGGTTVASLQLNPGEVFAAKSKEGEYFLVKILSVQDDGLDSGSGSNLDYSRYEIKK